MSAVSLAIASSLVVPWPGASDAHVPPWHIAVSGQPTGVVAVGALDPMLAGPGARWLAAAATRGDWQVPPLSWEQSEVSSGAWKTVASIGFAHGLVTAREIASQPAMSLPAWTGKSAGLAYALAYLDSAPLNPTPGTLMQGRTVAATGVLAPSGRVLPVEYVPSKLAAAQEAGADIMLMPWRSFDAFRAAGFDEYPDDIEIVPVFSLKDAVRYLCATGGDAPACNWVKTPRCRGQGTSSPCSVSVLTRALNCLKRKGATGEVCLDAMRPVREG